MKYTYHKFSSCRNRTITIDYILADSEDIENFYLDALKSILVVLTEEQQDALDSIPYFNLRSRVANTLIALEGVKVDESFAYKATVKLVMNIHINDVVMKAMDFGRFFSGFYNTLTIDTTYNFYFSNCKINCLNTIFNGFSEKNIKGSIGCLVFENSILGKLLLDRAIKDTQFVCSKVLLYSDSLLIKQDGGVDSFARDIHLSTYKKILQPSLAELTSREGSLYKSLYYKELLSNLFFSKYENDEVALSVSNTSLTASTVTSDENSEILVICYTHDLGAVLSEGTYVYNSYYSFKEQCIGDNDIEFGLVYKEDLVGYFQVANFKPPTLPLKIGSYTLHSVVDALQHNVELHSTYGTKELSDYYMKQLREDGGDFQC